MTSVFTMLIAIIAAFIFAVIINSVICSGKSSDEAAEAIAISAADGFREAFEF